MKKINLLMMTLLTALLFTLSACSDDGDSSSGGSGDNTTTGDTIIKGDGYNIINGSWEVYNAKGLLAFYDNVTYDNNSLNVKLTDNITLELNSDNTSNWTPISTYRGIFDGNNHTITNVAIHEPLLSDVAFFNDVYGTVKNVKFDNISVTGDANVAGVASALQSGGILENVSTDNKSNIHSNSEAGGNGEAGGLVHVNNGTIVNSSNSASVTGDSVGGIVRENFGTVIASSNAGTITGSDWKGGVVGYNRGIITACYNTGTIAGSGSTGGIAGNNDGGTITSVYNIGEITGIFTSGIVRENKGVISGAYSLSNVDINAGVDPINSGSGTSVDVYDVDNISMMNTADNLTILNNGIDDFEDFVKIGYGYRFVDGGSNAPQLETVPIVLRGISVSANVTSIEPGGNTTQLIVETNPSNVEYPSLKFTPSDESVATVSDNGTVTSGSTVGNVTITVSTADNAFRATIEIKVEEAGHEIVNGTWMISKANGLAAFREAVNNGGTSLNAILTDNITLDLNSDNSSNWTPISTYRGIFDGDNHTITNVAIHEPLLSDVAFLNDVYGTVKNVKFDNISVTGDIIVGGVVVSLISGGILENVSTDNKSNIHSNGYAGGLVHVNNGTIVNSSNSASVTGDSVGGIACENFGTVIASYNAGTITGSDWKGGIVGYNFSQGDIIASYNAGTIAGSSSTGGIVGGNSGTITSVYNIGEITGASAGGIASYNEGEVSGAYSLSNVDINAGLDPINSGPGTSYNVDNISAISELNDETETTGELWILNNYLNNEDWEFYDDGNANTAPIIRRKP